jgi:hypothetical protein
MVHAAGPFGARPMCVQGRGIQAAMAGAADCVRAGYNER